MQQYDISVIVPVFNAEKYLNQCVDSILAQTKDNIEIVLVNDGSTDRSVEIINDYAKKHNNVVAIHQENGGLAAARVAGLNNASGKYIGWVDADDFISPDMYKKLYELLKTNNADYVYCDYKFYPHPVKGKEKWFKQYYGSVDWNYIERNSQAWNTLTSRDLLDEIKIVELYPMFREYSWIAVLLNAKKTMVLDEPLYFYRVGMNSMSGGSYKGKVFKFQYQVKITSELHALIDGTKYEEQLKPYFDYRHIYTLLQLCIVAAINSDSKSYNCARRGLFEKQFRKNPLVKEILDNNHGKKKSFVLRNVIPINYHIARMLTRLFYGE